MANGTEATKSKASLQISTNAVRKPSSTAVNGLESARTTFTFVALHKSTGVSHMGKGQAEADAAAGGHAYPASSPDIHGTAAATPVPFAAQTAVEPVVTFAALAAAPFPAHAAAALAAAPTAAPVL